MQCQAASLLPGFLPTESALTVAELALAYLRFAKSHYRKDGQPTKTLERIRVALRILRQSYARQRVDQQRQRAGIDPVFRFLEE